MSKRLILILVLLALALMSSVAVWRLQPKPKPVPVTEARSDYTLENFELVTLDESGRESFSVRAPHLERDPQGKSLTITSPNFSFPDKGGGRWTATAGTAWVGPKGERVRLLKDVDMIGPPGAAGERTRMQTALLEILPKRDKASSPGVVTITRGKSILRGTGLAADLASHRIQLLANVKGRYAPAR
jgi:lipopolysaccharide export system protein LptC